MKNLIKKYREVITYLFFGVCTTLINIFTYFIFRELCNFSIEFSTIFAWLLAVCFAFITNKLFVFECKSWEKGVVFKEAKSFFVARVLTGVLDFGIMEVFAKTLLYNEFIVKTVSNIIVIVLNYIASKLFIFKRKT